MIKRLLRTGAILIGCAVVFFGTLQCILNTSVNNINKVNMNTVYNETYSKMNKAIPTAQVVQKMDKNHYNLHDSKPKDASELDSQTSGFLDQSELRVLESTFEQSKTAESYGRFQKSFSNIYEVISGIILFLMVLVTLISSSKIADIMDYWKYLFAISKSFLGSLLLMAGLFHLISSTFDPSKSIHDNLSMFLIISFLTCVSSFIYFIVDCFKEWPKSHC